MAWGELVRWNDQNGFGFVRSDYPSQEDVFVHRIVLGRAGIHPVIGTALEFETELHEGRPRVASCRRLSKWNDSDNHVEGADKLTGRISFVSEEKRFAFVARDDRPGVRVFCKLNDLGRNGVPAVIGARVVFEIGERGGRPCVVDIEPLEED